jgi:fructose-1,6-bisphosphatase-3
MNQGADMDLKYLELLKEQYPDIAAASTELINLSAILQLPKGTEYFISDIHGEYDAFNHYLKNASGIIQEKIKQLFVTYPVATQQRLAFFIYYPTDMIAKYERLMNHDELVTLQRQLLLDMVRLAKVFASKYTKSKVRKYLPHSFAYVMQELLYESQSNEDKQRYYEAILDAVFSTNRQVSLLMEWSRLIRTLAIDHLHIVGDIFDRGPYPHLVMNKLMRLKNVDVQWGNHDIIWMGAASGCPVSIANVIRIAAKYNNLDCLEDGYGINLRLLAMFALRVYALDPCEQFIPSNDDTERVYADTDLVAKIHKAISILQFKLEAALIERNPSFELEHRLLLDKIDYSKGSVLIDGVTYLLRDSMFVTIDPAQPYALTIEEQQIIDHLKQSFLTNDLLQDHIRWMFDKGSMALAFNESLLFHAAIPLNDDGSWMTQVVDGVTYHGKALMDVLEQKIRIAYQNRSVSDVPERDYFNFLWQAKASPLFAKHAMKTFERYFIAEKSTHKEVMNPYFTLRQDSAIIDAIFREFSMDPTTAKIVNGHVPVDVTKGDDVVVANQRVFLIDGGMSKQFKGQTTIGGYTLIADSYAYYLVSHSRFDSFTSLIERELDIVSVTRFESLSDRRLYVYDTDIGARLHQTITDLKALIHAYQTGHIKEAIPFRMVE